MRELYPLTALKETLILWLIKNDIEIYFGKFSDQSQPLQVIIPPI